MVPMDARIQVGNKYYVSKKENYFSFCCVAIVFVVGSLIAAAAFTGVAMVVFLAVIFVVVVVAVVVQCYVRLFWVTPMIKSVPARIRSFSPFVYKRSYFSSVKEIE